MFLHLTAQQNDRNISRQQLQLLHTAMLLKMQNVVIAIGIHPVAISLPDISVPSIEHPTHHIIGDFGDSLHSQSQLISIITISAMVIAAFTGIKPQTNSVTGHISVDNRTTWDHS